MSSIFELTRDAKGQVSYGLEIIGLRKEGAIIPQDAQELVVIGDNDQYAVFFPNLGGNYLVSPQQITNFGASFATTDALLNIAHISLINWPFDLLNSGQKSIYVYAVADDLQISVLIGKGLRV